MKSYRLKKWYPSLHKDWVVGDIVIPWEKQKDYYHIPNKSTTIYKEEVENNPDFWELIEDEKPLFITYDGIKVFDRDTIVYSVRNNASAKIEISAEFLSKYDFEHRVFFHESSADDYIWRNKRVFSYEDFKKFQSGVAVSDGIWYDVKAIAKERSNNEF